MYIALTMRPDISFAVAALSQYNWRPFAWDLTAAQQVLRYLKVTQAYCLCYNSSPTGPHTLIRYSDTELASSSADRKTQTGHIFLLTNTISLQSQKQESLAT
jgi:hypothetical protein